MRGTTLSDRHGVALTLPNGTPDNPSLRFGGSRSGLYRTELGDLALSIKKFLTLGISEDGLLVRSNGGSLEAPSARVTPLLLDRANATAADGDETSLDIQEVGLTVGRLALYREAANRRSWRFYGYTAGGLNTTPILKLDGDGTVAVPGSLVVETNTNLGNTTIEGGLAVEGSATITGSTTLEGTLAVEGNATFSQSISVEGGISVSAPNGLTPPLGIGGPGVPYASPTPGNLLSLYPTATLLGLRQGAAIDHSIILANAAPNATPTANALIGLSPSGSGHLAGGVANSLSISTNGAAAGALILGTAGTARLTIATNGQVTIPGAVSLGSTLNVTGLINGNNGLTITAGTVTLPAASLPSTVIANQTIVEAAPATDNASVGVLLNNLAHRIMSIIGAAGNDWKDVIPRTLTQLLADVQLAKSTADTGVTNAATAQTQANLGVTNAAAAQGTANTAVANAAAAQTQANLGVNNAQLAWNNAQGRVARGGDTMTGGLTATSLSASGGGNSLTAPSGNIVAGGSLNGNSLAITASATIGNALDLGGTLTCSSLVVNGAANVRTLAVTNTTMYGGGAAGTAVAFAYVVFNGAGYKVALYS